MSYIARGRVVLARHPWLYWALVAGCALMAWSTLAHAQAAAQRTKAAWGRTTPVWVAVADIAPGTAVHAERRDYPSAIVPSAAVDSLPGSATAARRIAAGAIVVRADLPGRGVVPSGWETFSVAADASPSLQPGDAVAVFADGRLLCHGRTAAPVASRDRAAIEVAVPPSCAPAMSQQVAAQAVVLARTDG